MARRRKRDFWDDMEDDVVSREELKNTGGADADQDRYTETIEDEGFSLTKCMPVKVIARILLCVAAVVIGLSGYIFYRYVDDRYANGTYTTSYFESNGFSREYNSTIERLIQALKAIEEEGDVTPERAAELATGLLGTDGNFSYYVLNEAGQIVVQSGEDAQERIGASNHFLRISNLDNQMDVESGVPTTGLNKNSWQVALDECSHAYQIYTSVDNNLSRQDSFYESYIDYQRLTDYFGTAKIAVIVAAVVFIILLVFCVIATGMRRGYAGVRLGWFDKVFTEIALIIIAAIIGGLIYGMFYLMNHDLSYGRWLKAADALLIYIFLIRGYFSLVRRIKSGTFITNAIIYKICHGINMGLNRLPRAVKILIIVLFLLVLNGGLIYGLLYWRDVTVAGIPLIFIIAPIIFVIELIAFISCIFGVDDGDDRYLREEDVPEEDVEDTGAEDDDEIQDWENVDFGSSIPEDGDVRYEDYSQTAGATVENVRTKTVDKTVVLSQDERRQVLDSLGFGATQVLDTAAVRAAEEASKKSARQDPLAHIPHIDAGVPGEKTVIMEPVKTVFDERPADMETVPFVSPANAAEKMSSEKDASAEEKASDNAVEGNDSPADGAGDLELVNFIQLNKDVRKLYRVKLKERSVGVTLRAPEKPILLDIDKSNAIKVLSILFENIVKYAEEGSRVYIEMYSQNGKMIYLMKNTIRADLQDKTTTAMGRGLMEARRIVQSEKGKFINSVEGDTYKVGILLDVASE